jgi:hypothetical protein
MVYVSEQAHHRLKVLAAQRNRGMGELVEELVDREVDELSNPWTLPEGLQLQQRALADAWSDPALDAYDDG